MRILSGSSDLARPALLLGTWLLVAAGAGAQDATPIIREPVLHRIERASSAIVVDGVVDEPAWADALRLELHYEVAPAENVEPPVATEVFLAHDDEQVYVAFRCHDPEPSEIRARYSDRDDIFKDDWVNIVFDTFGDQRRAYEFLVNPLGVQMDAINNDVNGSFDTSWDAIWQSAGHITEYGYEVEMAIPFHQIRFPGGGAEQSWGLDAARSYPRVDRHHIGLFPRQRGANSYLGQTDRLVGMAGITPGRSLEVAPTLTGHTVENRAEPSAAVERDDDAELGLTVKWGVTPDLTLSGALNPDFSQVEADALQLDINEQFALYYEEKRPFFLEALDTFTTRTRLVHTRTVADPSFALKLTGKQGRHTFGLFSARDQVTNILLPGPHGSTSASFDLDNTSTVARYRYDMGRNSTVGAVLTDRRGGDYASSVLAFDAELRLGPADHITCNLAASTTTYDPQMVDELGLAEEEADGGGLFVEYVHSERDWFAFAAYTHRDDGFRSDLGFRPQVGLRISTVGGARVLWGGIERWFNRLELGAELDHATEQDGELIESELEVWAEYEGPCQTEAVLVLGARDRRWDGTTYDLLSQGLYLSLRPGGDLGLELNVEHADWIDFTHSRAADLWQVNPGATLNLGRHLELQLAVLYSTLQVAEGRLYEARAPELRARYQFNTRTFLRLVLQHTDIRRTTRLYSESVDARSEDLFSQVLFSYKLNPQTVFFAGYSDTALSGDRVDTFHPNRTLFVKLGYAWLR